MFSRVSLHAPVDLRFYQNSLSFIENVSLVKCLLIVILLCNIIFLYIFLFLKQPLFSQLAVLLHTVALQAERIYAAGSS